MTYRTNITIWSKIGHTPITERNGAYCDVLAKKTTDCKTPEDATAATKTLIKSTRHGSQGYFEMPEYSNQNRWYGFVV